MTDAPFRRLAARDLPPEQLLRQGAETMGLALEAAQLAQLDRYLAEMQRWNLAYNLTAIRDPRGMVVRHLLDSLALLACPEAAPLLATGAGLDVGSGAGLPGVVLALCLPQVTVTVLDSNGKKTRFLRHVQRTLGMANLQVAEARIEQWQCASGYQWITSRAFAQLSDFVSGSAHLLAPGGHWLAMKGRLDPAELALPDEKYRIEASPALSVPGLDESRHVVICGCT